MSFAFLTLAKATQRLKNTPAGHYCYFIRKLFSFTTVKGNKFQVKATDDVADRIATIGPIQKKSEFMELHLEPFGWNGTRGSLAVLTHCSNLNELRMKNKTAIKLLRSTWSAAPNTWNDTVVTEWPALTVDRSDSLIESSSKQKADSCAWMEWEMSRHIPSVLCLPPREKKMSNKSVCSPLSTNTAQYTWSLSLQHHLQRFMATYFTISDISSAQQTTRNVRQG